MLAYTNNNKVYIYIYEYRISLLSDSQNGSDNILNLGKSTDDMDKKCMAIYDFYYSLSYILNILIFGALVLILIFFEWTIIANIRTMASQNKTIQKIKLSQTNLVIFIAFLNILSISIGYILTRVLNIALNYSFLSINNPTAFILILVFSL